MGRFWGDFPLWIGLALFLAGILVPSWFDPAVIGLPSKLTDLGLYPTGNRIVLNALGLIVIDSVRTLPLILGAFVLGDRIAGLSGRLWLQYAVAPGLVLLAGFVSWLHPAWQLIASANDSFRLNGAAVLSLVAMGLLQKLAGGRLGLGTKVLLLTEIILGVHCLDVVPGLNLYVNGQDPMVRRLQEFALADGLDAAIGFYALTLFLGFEGSAVILATMLVLAAQKLEVEHSLHHAQLEAVEFRAGQEVLHLVHDLKTPLTTVEGLVSLIQLKSEDRKVEQYCSKISEATGSMSNMISEILYGEELAPCRLQEVLDYLLAGCRFAPALGPELLEPEYRDALILTNRIRLARAVINLIDNAFEAVGPEAACQVTLRACVEGENIGLGVEDNGPGITGGELEHVWEAGYSTKGHAGLGLAFVRKVAEEHGGFMRIESNPGQSTAVWIMTRKGCA